MRVLDVLHPPAHARRPGYLDSAAEFVHADVRDGAAVARALDSVEHACHQAAMVGLGTDLGDIGDYVSHNDLGTAVLLRELARMRFGGRLVLASSMVVYGEGRYSCAVHGRVRPGPRREAQLRAALFEPPCPACGGPLQAQSIPEDEATDPRNVYAATKFTTTSIYPRG